MFKENIYDLMIRYPNLNDQVLHKYGYTDEDINRFKERRIISDIGGVYVADNLDDILKYYKSVSRNKDYSKQAKIMDLVLSIEPNYYHALQQRFFLSIKLNDIETALYCFKSIYSKFKNRCRFDALMELFLLSKLIYVGEELDKEAELIEFKDIRIPITDTRYKNVDVKNEARKKVLNYEFNEAYDMAYAEPNYDKLTFQELTIITLLNRVASKYRNGHNYIECINQGRYVDALYSINKKEVLTHYEKLVVKLLEFITNPPNEVFIDYNHAYGLWESIYANDFYKALELSENYNKDRGMDDSTSPISNILRDIISMLDVYVNYDDLEDKSLYGVYLVSNLIDHGYSFEEALNVSNLSLEDKLYTTLIYAKEAYKMGNMEFGNRLLALYGQINKIDDSYQELYEDIRKNRKSLVNQPSTLQRTLTIPNNLQ